MSISAALFGAMLLAVAAVAQTSFDSGSEELRGRFEGEVQTKLQLPVLGGTPAPSCGGGKAGVTYRSFYTISLPELTSLEACHAKCQSSAPCGAWTFVAADKTCWLKGGKIIEELALPGACAGLSRKSGLVGLNQYTFNFAMTHSMPPPPEQAFSCQGGPLPALWKPSFQSAAVQVKVMSYNLEWWRLFDDGRPTELMHYRATPGNTGTQLVSKAKVEGYDVMAFQECADGPWLAGKAGLAAEFTMLHSSGGRCLAFRKAVYGLLASGEAGVTEDGKALYWGRRGVQWARLRHLQSGAPLLVANHHGPLPTNSGGACGEAATARNILQVMAANARPGDALVLLGDFNANAAGQTVKVLQQRLPHVLAGTAEGGVDHVFSNLKPVQSATLGTGGSDHAALGVALSFAA